MARLGIHLSLAALLGISILVAPATQAGAESQVARGKYLVTISGCSDCHTPGSLLGKPDMSRFLGGSDVGFAIPGLGVFVPPNLTSDKDTGLGKWTTAQIVTAMTTGKIPTGRMLAPIMPYMELKALTHSDALAIVAYLRSLKPVSHAVPGPFGPKDKVTVFVETVMPPDAYNNMPAPPMGAPPKQP